MPEITIGGGGGGGSSGRPINKRQKFTVHGVVCVYIHINAICMYRESEKNSSHVLIVIDANALEEHTYLNNGDRYCNQTHKQDTSTHYFPVEMLP